MLLVLAAVLRSISLDSDLWMDEVFSLVRTIRPDFWEILSVFVDDNQHTLYSLAAKACVAVFGETPVAVRLPAVVFGVASIWVTARLARLVFGDGKLVIPTIPFQQTRVYSTLQGTRKHSLTAAARLRSNPNPRQVVPLAVQ